MRCHPTLLLLIALAIFPACLPASTPITVVYGYGRNKTAIDLWQKAEDELKTGHDESALRNVNLALRADPTLYPAFYTRAKVYARAGQYQAAMHDCSEALRQDSTFVEASLFRAHINLSLGHYRESLKEINHIISIHPRSDGLARAFADRAWLRATARDPAFRDGRKAISDATRACRLTSWKDEDMIDTLAAAHAEADDFDSAVRYEEQAIAMKDVLPRDMRFLQEHLQMFKKRQPLRSGG